MTYLLLPLILLLLFPTFSWADTHAANSCSLTDVNTAVTAASEGDTVSVPAGSCTWSSQLAITTGITLQGAGSGVGGTAITGGLGNTTCLPSNASSVIEPGCFLVTYNPTTPANNAAFILTGFSFDLADGTWPLRLANTDTANPITKIRIHHNAWTNMHYKMGNNDLFHITSSTVFGVADSNTFQGEFVAHHAYAPGSSTWDSLTYAPGNANSFYWEDNTFTVNPSAENSGASPTIGAGEGTGYVVRYNTFNYTRIGEGGVSLSPWFDEHGNQGASTYSSTGVEIYGNVLNTYNYTWANSLAAFALRGGVHTVFYNKIAAADAAPIYTIGTNLMEEYADNTSTTSNTCSGAVEGDSCAADGTYQHINKGYSWNNRGTSVTGGSNALIIPTLATDCATSTADCRYNGGTGDIASILPNVQYWTQGASFDGTSGVGCGTLGNRPATCTAGVAYWATTQSCSDLTGMIGATPATPISGTLYICGASNWGGAGYTTYTPYQYPHPLRGEGESITSIIAGGTCAGCTMAH